MLMPIHSFMNMYVANFCGKCWLCDLCLGADTAPAAALILQINAAIASNTLCAMFVLSQHARAQAKHGHVLGAQLAPAAA